MNTSIIIPTYNRLVFTRICVQGLSATLGDRDDVEVIIVDNGSTDETIDFLRELPSPFRVIINSTNRGYARACNQGANAAQGHNLLLLNNDTVPLPGWLNPLEDRLRQTEIGIVGSKLLFPDDTIQHAGIAITESLIPAHLYYLFPRDYPPANVERDYQAVTGACLGIRRSLFFEIGGLDEGYQNSFEDIDLCLRARVSGYRVVYCPESVLYHFESVSEGRHTNDDANQMRYLARWKQFVKVDELQWYEQDGFTTVPRVPARTLSQALGQLTMERRRSYALASTLSGLQAQSEEPHVKIGHPKTRSNDADRGRVQVSAALPSPLPAGEELFLEARIHGSTKPSLDGHQPTLDYAWQLLGMQTTVWRGEAAQFADAVDHLRPVRVKILSPSIPGPYVLTWIIKSADQERVVGQQPVMVASRFGFQCYAHLPSKFVAKERYRVIVRLKNTGTEAWLPHGGFRLSYHWLDETGEIPVVWEGIRTPILDRVSFGEETVVEASVLAPPNSGRCQFIWDPILEGEFWFSDLKVAGPRTNVEIEPTNVLTGVPALSSTPDGERQYRAELFRQGRRIAELELAFRTRGERIEALQQSVRASERVIQELEQIRHAHEDAISSQEKEIRWRTDVTENLQRDVQWHERRRNALEQDVNHSQTLTTALQQRIDALERDIGLIRLENTELHQLFQAVERGRVMRVLNTISRWTRSNSATK